MARSTKKSTVVPGQFLGYSLQVQRVLSRLLSSDSSAFVSLEVFDDVGVEFPDGSQLAEQGKSFHDSNPVSNHARDLWKTLSNWIDSIESNLLKVEKTQFVIYLFKPSHGVIVDTFSAARTKQDAQEAFIAARKTLWGNEPDYSLRSRISPTIEPYVTKFFSANENLVCQLIMNFSLECGSGNTNDDLMGLLRTSIIPEEILHETLNFCLGWVKGKIDSMIEQGNPAIVSKEEFRIKVTAFVRARDRRTILTSYSQNPRQEEITSNLESFRTYIRQLDLVECEDDQKVRAIIDFMKAESDRTTWSVKGMVDASSFDEFEESLKRAWDNIRRKIGIDLADRDEITRGKRIYLDCSLHKAKLEGIDVPDHFTPGSFHALSDVEIIGWHPDYRNKLNNNFAE